jgi:hypothetical protein
MRPTFDLLAGRRARILAQDPAAPLPIQDPTDPRQGAIASAAPGAVFDPTDPRCEPKRDAPAPTAPVRAPRRLGGDRW